MTKKEQITQQIASTETIHIAGGCLWGVQEFLKYLLGVLNTETGRANGITKSTKTSYDGFAECLKTVFYPKIISVENLIQNLIEMIEVIRFVNMLEINKTLYLDHQLKAAQIIKI